MDGKLIRFKSTIVIFLVFVIFTSILTLSINQSNQNQDFREFNIEIPVLQTQYNATQTFSEVGKFFPLIGMRMQISFKNDVSINQMNIILNLVFVRNVNAPIFQTTPGYGYFTSFSNTNLNYISVGDVFYTFESIFGFFIIYNITDKSINENSLKDMSIVLKLRFIFARDE